MGRVLASRNEPAKDAIAELAASSKRVWDYGQWVECMHALERSSIPVDEWLLTV